MNDMTENRRLTESVLERLERDSITPRSRFYWMTQEYGLWGAWFASVILGSLALSIVSFSSLYIGYSLYEATHDNFLTFILDTLPYAWFAAFAIMLLAAYFNLRHTKNGYRYSFLLVAGSSFGFSVAGGILLHFLGIGYYLDQYLGQSLETYHSRAELETLAWQNPPAGRLVGHGHPPAPAGVISGSLFTDVRDREWQIMTTDLSERETDLLRSGRKVRVLVATSSSQADEALVACGVFPWLLDEAPIIAKLRDDRRIFIENIKQRRERVVGTIKDIKDTEPGEDGKTEKASLVLASIAELPGTPSAAITLNTASGQPSPCGKLPMFMPLGLEAGL